MLDDFSTEEAHAACLILEAHNSLNDNFTLNICDKRLGTAFGLLKRRMFKGRSNIEILVALGINPMKHTGQPLSILEKILKKTKEQLLKELIRNMDSNGADLSDNSMNTAAIVDYEHIFKSTAFSECKNCQTAKQITRRSIYAQGLKLHNSWSACLLACGIDITSHQRKVAARKPLDYLDAAFQFFDENPNWNASILRSSNSIAWGLRHKRNQQCLPLLHNNLTSQKVDQSQWLFAAWVSYRAKQAGIEIVEYFIDNEKLLWDEYKSKHIGQEVWEEGRVEIEILKKFARGERITRMYLENSQNNFDRTLLAAARGKARRDDKGDYNYFLKQAGFIPNVLKAIYEEQDDTWTRSRCLEEAQALLAKRIEQGEKTLSRDWCKINAKEFHDALLRKVHGKSWETALRWIGLDPNFHAMTASTRARRGILFQDFFREVLIRIGLKEVETDSYLDSDSNFVYRKGVGNCSHSTRCQPDFLFKEFIIDTKTGIGAITETSDQLLRYTQHRRVVYLVTLNQTIEERAVGDGVVTTFSYANFVEISEHILGVRIPNDTISELTALLNRVGQD